MKTDRKQAEGPDDPEPAAKGHIHMEYSFD
jgi:hypothetical protein